MSGTFNRIFERLLVFTVSTSLMLVAMGIFSSALNNYDVDKFSGDKSIILSTSNVFGGDNTFLGICFIVVGGISLLFGIGFIINHFIQNKGKEKEK